MMHQPVVPKARLERQPFSIANTARSALSIFEVPREHLRRLPAPDSKFADAVNIHWVRQAHKNAFAGIIAYTSIDAMLTVSAGLPTVLMAPASFPIVFGIWTALQAGLLPFGIAYSRVHRAQKRNFNAFLIWLKGRYGVTLSSKQGLPKYLLTRKSYDNLQIMASDGRELRIYNDHGLWMAELNGSGELQKSVLAERPRPVQVAPEMTPAAKQLCDELGEHLTVLGARQLMPESAHVVERATRDRQQVVALHADLARLNALDEQQEAAIEHSFATLLSELKAVLQVETKAALMALSVENKYITARSERDGIELQKGR